METDRTRLAPVEITPDERLNRIVELLALASVKLAEEELAETANSIEAPSP